MTRTLLITLLLLVTLPLKADAPDMRLMNVTGVEEPMNKYIGKGKWVVVNSWSPTCSSCVTELPQIKSFIQQNPDVPMLGVTLDFPSFTYGKMDIVQEFLKHNPLEYPIFLADTNLTEELIGRRLIGIPSITIFHPDGRALVTWPGVIEIDAIEDFIANYEEDIDPISIDFN
jgi:thiol-disulfide isomerase/thioredoxin